MKTYVPAAIALSVAILVGSGLHAHAGTPVNATFGARPLDAFVDGVLGPSCHGVKPADAASIRTLFPAIPRVAWADVRLLPDGGQAVRLESASCPNVCGCGTCVYAPEFPIPVCTACFACCPATEGASCSCSNNLSASSCTCVSAPKLRAT